MLSQSIFKVYTPILISSHSVDQTSQVDKPNINRGRGEPCQGQMVKEELWENSISYQAHNNIGQSVQSLSCVRLCDPMNHSTPGLPVHHQLLEFTQTHVHQVMPSSHLILYRPLLLLPPIPPSIRVFSSESTLRMRYPKYWSFSFNISPSNEHPGLISFRMD